jgi:hypothetical protein
MVCKKVQISNIYSFSRRTKTTILQNQRDTIKNLHMGHLHDIGDNLHAIFNAWEHRNITNNL